MGLTGHIHGSKEILAISGWFTISYWKAIAPIIPYLCPVSSPSMLCRDYHLKVGVQMSGKLTS